MATIASNSLFPGGPAINGTANGTSAGTTSALPTGSGAGSAQDASGTFMELVTGMIQGNTPSPSDPLPANLAAFLLTGDGEALQGIETETTDTDDEEGDDEALLALSALLPGLQAFQPVPAANAAPNGGPSLVSVDLSNRQGAMQTLLDTSQAALTAAIDDPADSAPSDATAADDAAAPAPAPNSASHMQTLLLAHKAAEAAPQAASAEVHAPVGSTGWSDEIGTHLTMMAANGREAASLRLSPEHLGPLEIRISMKDGEASVYFGASNPDTRSALEQSLPRLREMFASQGLVLGDANVSRDTPRDTFRPATFANASRGSSDAAIETGVKPVTLSRLGLVDTYV
jgi:flagellar hook-length control protein FliK